MSTVTVATFREMLELERDQIARCHSGTAGFHYSCLQDFVLREGEVFERIAEDNPYPRGEPRACYRNAAHLALDYRELTYVEGYAFAKVFPMLHAWCVNSDDEVVDCTWGEQTNNAGLVYMGVRFDSEEVFRAAIENRHYGMLDIWEKSYPILHHPFRR